MNRVFVFLSLFLMLIHVALVLSMHCSEIDDIPKGENVYFNFIIVLLCIKLLDYLYCER